jgi:hypothetical protein
MTTESMVKWAGLIVGIIALFFTACQIRATNKTLVFTTEQNIYKESREIRKYMADNPELVARARLSEISQLTENESTKLRMQIGMLLSFYNSILQENNKRYVSEDFRSSLISDFCIMAGWPQVAARLPNLSTPPAVSNKPPPFRLLAELKRSHCNA